jgi:3-dehydroquinate dehydratase
MSSFSDIEEERKLIKRLKKLSKVKGSTIVIDPSAYTYFEDEKKDYINKLKESFVLTEQVPQPISPEEF